LKLPGGKGSLPLYPYRCTKCGYRFEKIQSFDSAPETECPKCGGALERPLTAPGLQFKGAGWYVTDYASKSGGSSTESSTAEAKGAADGKPAASEKPASSESSSGSSSSTPATAGSGAS
jgi:putative FmdB family regulatory protein